MVNKTQTEPTINVRLRKATMRRLKILAAHRGTTVIEYADQISSELMKELKDFTEPVKKV